MNCPRVIGAFANDLFATNDETMNQQQLDDVKNSGFTTITLWPIHFTASGDLTYGDGVTDPIVEDAYSSRSATRTSRRWLQR